MRCVSYTRTTDCRPNAEPPENPITLQNESIRSYVKQRGWKLTARYSDRKKDPQEISGFLQMRQDGMTGKFDCVVIHDLYHCGTDVFQAARLFKTVFFPAGIHFAVVEDAFCSMDKDRDEVEGYLAEACSRQLRRIASNAIGNYDKKHRVAIYGYRYLEKENRLELDEEVAPVVEEIFSLIADGKKTREVAAILNEEGVETPKIRMSRLQGWRGAGNTSNVWNEVKVRHIAENDHYLGHWSAVVDGKDIGKECPGIIDKELFDVVRGKLDAGRRKTPLESDIHPLAGLVYDKETGHPLAFYKMASRDRTRVIRFRYPRPENIDYPRRRMANEDFIKRIRELLDGEKEKAQRCLRLIGEGEGNVQKEQMMSPVRKQALGIIDRLYQNEMEMLSIQEGYDSGGLDYAMEKDRNRTERKDLAGILEGLMEQMAEIERAYSKKNPWIQLFLSYDKAIQLTQREGRKYFYCVYLYRFESVEPVFQEERWRDYLPPEWVL